MKEFYNKLEFEKKVLFISILVSSLIFILSIPFFFFNWMSIPLGILLGELVGLLNYVLLVRQVYYGLATNRPRTKAAFHYMLRFIIYGSAFVLALALEKWVYPIFNIFAVLGGIFVHKIVLIIMSYRRKE